MSMRIVIYLIEYLGEIDFIFETMLDYESVDHIDSFGAKKHAIENLTLGHLYGQESGLHSKTKENTR
jgi:hypothetical protein